VIDFTRASHMLSNSEQTEKTQLPGDVCELAQRAGRIGYRINKVVYRGYQATDKLQAMHDNAIEARTRLKLDAETEAQAQEIADLRLKRDQERARQRQEMERRGSRASDQIKRIGHEEQLRQQAGGTRSPHEAPGR